MIYEGYKILLRKLNQKTTVGLKCIYEERQKYWEFWWADLLESDKLEDQEEYGKWDLKFSQQWLWWQPSGILCFVMSRMMTDVS
jgi:hypothetical protein